MIRALSLRALSVACLQWAAFLVGCTVDTELGVDATLEEASVAVASEAEGDVVSVDLGMVFRVGEHAEGERQFIVPRAQIFVGDRPAAEINLDAPAGFDGFIAPGERERVDIGGSTPPGAFPGARDLLCAGDVTATVLVQWDDVTAMEPGMVDAPTGAIRCD